MKILIVKTSSLGDIIQAFPVIDYLREKFREITIDWVVEKRCMELVQAHCRIDRVISIESRKWRKHPIKELRKLRASLGKYDVAFDLQGNLKSGIALCCARAKAKVGFGWKSVAEWPNIFFTNHKINPYAGQNIREEYLAVVQQFFKDDPSYPLCSNSLLLSKEEQKQVDSILSDAILVAPGSAWPNKQLSISRLLAYLKRREGESFLFVSGTEKERKEVEFLANQLPKSTLLDRVSLPVLQHVMAKSKLVITMDSLPLHLCGTTKTPTMSFFGPSSAKKYRPLGKGHQVFQGACPYGEKFQKRCSKLRSCPTGACLKSD